MTPPAWTKEPPSEADDERYFWVRLHDGQERIGRWYANIRRFGLDGTDATFEASELERWPAPIPPPGE